MIVSRKLILFAALNGAMALETKQGGELVIA